MENEQKIETLKRKQSKDSSDKNMENTSPDQIKKNFQQNDDIAKIIPDVEKVESKNKDQQDIDQISIISNYSNPQNKIYDKIPIYAFFPSYQTLYTYIMNYFQYLEENHNKNRNKENNIKEDEQINPLVSGTILINANEGHLLSIFFQKLVKNLQCDFFLISKEIIEKNDQNKDQIEKFSWFSNLMSIIKKKYYIAIWDLLELKILQKKGEKQNTIEQLLTDISTSNNQGINIFISSPFALEKFDNWMNFFDISWDFSPPDLETRTNFLNHIFNALTNNFDKRNYASVARQLENFNFESIAQVSKYFLNYTLINERKYRVHPESITTQNVLNFLNDHKMVSHIIIKHQENIPIESRGVDTRNEAITMDENTSLTSQNTISLEEQLYQEAVGDYYQDLSIILDKIQNGIILEDYERNILANYSFVLKSTPQTALSKLNKAKQTLDRIKKKNQ